jgi:hypothetical protein
MSEEILAKYWFMGIVIIIVMITLIGHFTGKNLPTKNKKIHTYKFALVSFSIITIYVFLSIPYVGFFYNFGPNEKFPAELNSNEDITKYVKDHHQRIERLERELEEARAESHLFREHYQKLLFLVMLGVLIYSYSQIFSSKKDDLEEIKSDQTEKL